MLRFTLLCIVMLLFAVFGCEPPARWYELVDKRFSKAVNNQHSYSYREKDVSFIISVSSQGGPHASLIIGVRNDRSNTIFLDPSYVSISSEGSTYRIEDVNLNGKHKDLAKLVQVMKNQETALRFVGWDENREIMAESLQINAGCFWDSLTFDSICIGNFRAVCKKNDIPTKN